MEHVRKINVDELSGQDVSFYQRLDESNGDLISELTWFKKPNFWGTEGYQHSIKIIYRQDDTWEVSAHSSYNNLKLTRNNQEVIAIFTSNPTQDQLVTAIKEGINKAKNWNYVRPAFSLRQDVQRHADLI